MLGLLAAGLGTRNMTSREFEAGHAAAWLGNGSADSRGYGNEPGRQPSRRVGAAHCGAPTRRCNPLHQAQLEPARRGR